MLPLDGVRILTVEQYGAGPFGTMFLADQGAEIIKIENPHDGGDISRGVGPHFLPRDDNESQGQSDSLFFQAFNRNKKSICLDLSKPQGRSVLHDLVTGAHGLCSNLRGDVPEKLGLTYAHLSAFNPKIVCAHLSAYGRTGPRASWPGFDYLMQAEAGYFALTGEPDGPPTRFGLSVVDFMTGLGLAYAFLAALTGARTTGTGRDIDVSLFDMALHNTSYLAAWYLNADYEQPRLERSAHPSLTPCQLYPTQDGWLFIMCNKEKFWPILCRAIEHPRWATDERFHNFAQRLANRPLVNRNLEEVLGRHPTAYWLERFAGKVPASPVNSLSQALENPFVTDPDAGRLQKLDHPQAKNLQVVASPVKCHGEAVPHRSAPALGEHTQSLLETLGYSAETIARLRDEGTVA